MILNWTDYSTCERKLEMWNNNFLRDEGNKCENYTAVSGQFLTRPVQTLFS